MKERPILFNSPMVRAVLAGTKTQTRRVVKFKPWHTIEERDDGSPWPWMYDNDRDADHWLPCPYGQPGDRLWVREAHWWFKDKCDPVTGYFPPKLTVDDVEFRADGDDGRKVWRPSIHMPRWASRITLEVVDVRVERLQDISEADAIAEGVFRKIGTTRIGDVVETATGGELIYASPTQAREEFRRLWESINGPGSWAVNPWLWVVAFKRLASSEAARTPAAETACSHKVQAECTKPDLGHQDTASDTAPDAPVNGLENSNSRRPGE